MKEDNATSSLFSLFNDNYNLSCILPSHLSLIISFSQIQAMSRTFTSHPSFFPDGFPISFPFSSLLFFQAIKLQYFPFISKLILPLLISSNILSFSLSSFPCFLHYKFATLESHPSLHLPSWMCDKSQRCFIQLVLESNINGPVMVVVFQQLAIEAEQLRYHLWLVGSHCSMQGGVL